MLARLLTIMLLLVSGGAWAEGYAPEVGLAKAASATRSNPDGTYSVDFTLRIQNVGTEPLIKVQIDDRLARELAPATIVSITGLRADGALSQVNAAFNGASENYLLSGTERLAINAEGWVYFTLTFDAQGQPGPFFNQAMAWAEGEKSGRDRDDYSEDGLDPDPDTPSDRPEDNPNPQDDKTPTPIELPDNEPVNLTPEIGLAKSAEPTQTIVRGQFPSIPSPNDANRTIDPADFYPFATTITLHVENLGDVELTEVQVRDDLSETFPAEVAFAVLGSPRTSGGLTSNPNFDGVANPRLLSGADALAIGASGSVSFDVAFNPGSVTGPFFNSGVTSAMPEPGTDRVDDESNNGTDPDPDGDGDPSGPGEDEPTPIEVPNESTPQIGLAKAAQDVVQGSAQGTEGLGTNEFAATIILRVENLGVNTLNQVQVQDDLRPTFADAADFRILNTPTATGGLPINLGYDGRLESDLLGPGATLGPGESESIEYRVAFTPGDAPGPFLNEAFAQGTSPGGQLARDQSTDGLVADPDQNGVADDPGEDTPTPIPVPETVQIGLAKAAEISTEGADLEAGEVQADFVLTVENMGTSPLLEVQVVDSLATTFAAANGWRLLASPTASGGLQVNPNFDGETETTLLLAGVNRLDPGQSETISLSVAVSPANAGQSFQNSAVTTGSSPQGEDTDDDSTNGLDPDPDGNGAPDESEPTPVDLPNTPSGPGALIGTVFLDLDHNDSLTSGEERLGGWRVIVVDADDRPVAERVTNLQGDYSVEDLPAGEYQVRFLHPDTGVTWAELMVTVVADATVRADLPVDPQGRVYDSLTRELVPGVTLRMVNADTGSPLPAACLLPDQQDQTIGNDAAYRFDIVLGASGQCPSGLTGYALEITAVPTPYLQSPSVLIPPRTDRLDATTCDVDPDASAPCVVQPNALPPTDAQSTGYFFEFAITAGDQDVVNNHIPLDRPASQPAAGDLVAIQKTSLTSQASVGDLVFFEVRIQNLTSAPLTDVSFSDDLPGGFALEPDSVQNIDLGPDAQVGTADDVVSAIGIAGTDPVTFGPVELAANATRVLRYGLRVGTGLTEGDFINQITPLKGGQVVGATATALVEITADPLFDDTTLIGKVFDDRDADGWQDPAHASGLVLRGGPYRDAMQLPDLRARRSEADLPPRLQMDLPQDDWSTPIELTSEQGTRLLLVQDGSEERTSSGEIAQGLNAQRLNLRIEKQNGSRRLIVENLGIRERGLPGVRLATVGGLIVEADEHGRYHLADVQTGRTGRGANVILKLDMSSLPDGAEVISENPRVLRVTQALMSRIDFAVKMPPAMHIAAKQEPGEVLEVVTRRELADLPPVRFGTGRVDIPEDYGNQLRELLSEYAGRRDLRITFVGHADPRRLRGRLLREYKDNRGLSEARAREVADFARGVLDLPSAQIGYIGRGAAEPLMANTGPKAWRANRRVEIELRWLEVTERRFAVHDLAAAPEMGRTEQDRERIRKLDNIPFATGRAELKPQLLARAERLVKQAGERPVRLTVVGHADDQPLNANGKRLFGDNQGLSRARAEAAAELLREHLDLPAESVVVEGRGATEPVADNSSAQGRAQNRRVELAVTTATPETLERRWIKPLQETATQYMAEGGSIWATEQPLAVTPKMDVLATQDQWSALAEAPSFRAYANYAAYVSRFELVIYAGTDFDQVRPLAVVPLERELGGVSLADADWQAIREHSEVQYVLRAYGRGDQSELFDETAARLLRIDAYQSTQQAARDASRQRGDRGTSADSVWGQNNIAVQRIATQGSMVRVQGIDLDPHLTLQIEGETVPIQRSGSFVWEQQRPVGLHQLNVTLQDAKGQQHVRELDVAVDGNYQFAVALANLTLGQNQLQGSLEPLAVDDHFDESVFIDGRVALYAKAKIKGRYLLTAQVDTTEDELSRLGDNLRREDPRRLFRQLDPDRYYPVYGDESNTVSDVDTQGAYYVRLEFDRSQLLWGNYNTGLTDTEFAQYNRTLYGAKVRHQSNSVTEYGDARRELTVFASEAQSAAAHVTFAATGGSLYYLKHTDIVMGSEKLMVEVRRRDSEQILDRQVMVEGRDYEIDALQGRIILRRPLSQVVNQRRTQIIRSSPLEGDDVLLRVDYEYVPDRFAADDLTVGVRGKVWAGDHLGLGVSKVVDERAGTDYDLEAVDITLRGGKGTYLRAEYARSDAQQNLAEFTSNDGGLSFRSGTTSALGGAGIDGRALAVEARVNLAEVNADLKGDLRAWWKDRDANFSAGRLSGSGVSSGQDTRDSGVDLYWEASDNITVNAAYSELDRDQLGSDSFARLQIDAVNGRISGGIEARYEDIEGAGLSVLTPVTTSSLLNPPQLAGRSVLSGATGQGEALLFGGRLGYALTASSQLYVAGQTVMDDRGNYADNDLVSLGVNTAITQRTRLGLELSDGDRGSAVMGALEVAATDGLRLNLAGGFGSGAISQFGTSYSYGEGHELYGSYSVDPDRVDAPRDLLTLGQRRQLGNSTRIFNETQFGKDDRYASTAHLFGLDYSGIQDWLFTASVQRSDNKKLGIDFDRTAASIGARLERDDYRLSSRLEYREDQGTNLKQRQYLSSNSFSWSPNPARHWLARLNLSWTDNDLDNDLNNAVVNGKSARFVEFDFGHAYRPVWNNRLNLLAKYSYLFDLPSEGQQATRADQRAHVFSTEALYDLTARIELGGKLAFKKGEERIVRDGGRWLDFGVRMAALRARYHALKRWDALVEYRWVADWRRDTRQHGAVLGAYRHLGEHMQIGVGYNFSGFDDDLKQEDYDSHGWFIDLIGKY